MAHEHTLGTILGAFAVIAETPNVTMRRLASSQKRVLSLRGL
jgi:hypothetical protein